MYQLCCYVPDTHLEPVKQALFNAGAGRIGAYDSCCWQILGQGQYRPLAGSDPFLGAQGQLEIVAEYKLELVCADEHLSAAIAALKQAHPYEEPAYQVWKLEQL
jgi:hypothetical protein